MEVRPGQGLLTLTMAGALLLTGCSGGESAGDRLQAVQAAYGRLKQFSAQAEVTADYGERVYGYNVAIEGNLDAGAMTVTEPGKHCWYRAHLDGRRDRVGVRWRGAGYRRPVREWSLSGGRHARCAEGLQKRRGGGLLLRYPGRTGGALRHTRPGKPGWMSDFLLVPTRELRTVPGGDRSGRAGGNYPQLYGILLPDHRGNRDKIAHKLQKMI